jgi:uncharacterized protein YxjI
VLVGRDKTGIALVKREWRIENGRAGAKGSGEFGRDQIRVPAGEDVKFKIMKTWFEFQSYCQGPFSGSRLNIC